MIAKSDMLASKMLWIKKAFLIFCCGAFFCALDGDVFIVQALAWVKMTYTFAHQDNLNVALKKTFDNRHPCEICKEIAKLNSKSSHVTGLSPEGKIKILQLCPASETQCFVAHLISDHGPQLYYVNSVYISPPIPPPRLI